MDRRGFMGALVALGAGTVVPVTVGAAPLVYYDRRPFLILSRGPDMTPGKHYDLFGWSESGGAVRLSARAWGSKG